MVVLVHLSESKEKNPVEVNSLHAPSGWLGVHVAFNSSQKKGGMGQLFQV
jgi:hypothetical protein